MVVLLKIEVDTYAPARRHTYTYTNFQKCSASSCQQNDSCFKLQKSEVIQGTMNSLLRLDSWESAPCLLLWQAWVLGVKEIMDPTLILILAWALGQIVKDLHASEWVSTAIGGSFKVELIPFMAAILACVMSYATGSVSWLIGQFAIR